MQTPNEILDVEDVPPNASQDPLLPNMEYPAGERFTLQMLGEPDDRDKLLAKHPNNTDAAFKRDTGLPKPSSLLLHYSYGASAIRVWGQHELYFLTDTFRKKLPVLQELWTASQVLDQLPYTTVGTQSEIAIVMLQVAAKGQGITL